MPFVSKSTLEELQQRNQQLSQEVAEFDEMRPHLELAGEIRTEIINLLGGPEDLSAQEIGELAYQKVLRAKVDEARDEVAARYEQEHRRTLYERLIGEIATTEGESISERVKKKVETDPQLAVELQESARRELAARAQDVVRDKITAEQAEVINQEAERQIELDRLDVRVALDRELDLNDPNVKETLKPGDIVELFFDTSGGRRARLTLTWTRDVNDDEGWVFTKCSEPLLTTEGNELHLGSDRFVSIGSINKDLKTGTPVVESDKLIVDLPIVLLQSDGEKTKQIPLLISDRDSSYDYGSHRYPKRPVVLKGTDFQTKSIVFEPARSERHNL